MSPLSPIPTVLYCFQNPHDSEWFRKHFSDDFNLLPAQSGQQAMQMLEARNVEINALILDQNQWPLEVDANLLNHSAVSHSRCIKILLHSALSVDHISRLLEKKTVHFCYQKPYDCQRLRSVVVAAKLGVSNRFQGSPGSISGARNTVLLLVDDEPQATRYLKKQIEMNACGFDVQVVSSGHQALLWLESNQGKRCVLLTDQRMPGMSGKELIGVVKARFPQVIRMLTSAYREVDIAINAVNEEGIFRYIAKPWRAEDIVKNTLEAMEYGRQRERQIADDVQRTRQDFARSIECRKKQVADTIGVRVGRAFGESALVTFFGCLKQVAVLEPATANSDSSEKMLIEKELAGAFCELLIARLNRVKPMLLAYNQHQVTGIVENLRVLWHAEDIQSTDVLSAFVAELKTLSEYSSILLSDLTLSTTGTCIRIANSTKKKFLMFSHLLGPVTRVSNAMLSQQVSLFLIISLWHFLGGEVVFTGGKQRYDLIFLLDASKEVVR